MEVILDNTSFTKRAYWLIKLRWIAAGFLLAAICLVSNILKVQLHQVALYSITACLFLYNILLYFSLNYTIKACKGDLYKAINRIIVLQISADLFILTAVLYFSGSVENPFSFYFIFHMIIASMLLSRRMSYLQATLAIVLFGALLTLEYLGIIRHYSLTGFVSYNFFQNGKFVLSVFFAFSTTIYLVVYMATSIVAQLRKQQASYKEANIQLQEKDQVKNKYILRVTHDIKSHLAAIKSCLDIVRAKMVGELNEKQTDLVERADHRAERCIAFITSLLKLTRMRLIGKIERENFLLKYSIFNSFASVENKAVNKGVKLNYNIEPTVGEVYGGSLLIEDTITNLLLNAIKYTPSGGNVSLKAKDQGDSVLIQIKDTGIGIPHDEIEKVFDEFYRASNAKSVERDGSGLGLSMAKEVIERHGGKIWVESDYNGSKFSFTIPKTTH